MSRITREVRRNPLRCRKDVLEMLMFLPKSTRCLILRTVVKCGKPEDHPPLKDIHKKEDGVGKKSHEGKFSNCFAHR